MVLCTDGLANVGLGALDYLQTDAERGAVEEFYESLGREVGGGSCRGWWYNGRNTAL